MLAHGVLLEAHSRVQPLVHSVLDGADEALLTGRLDAGGNTVAWLIWHLTRVQDDHVAEVAGHPQVWSQGWAKSFGLPFDPTATGYGQDSEDVAAVRVGADLLAGYYDAVHARTVDYLRGLTDADLDRVIDERFDPPVTLGIRLVSVIDDDLEHAGQAAFLRGTLQRR